MAGVCIFINLLAPADKDHFVSHVNGKLSATFLKPAFFKRHYHYYSFG